MPKHRSKDIDDTSADIEIFNNDPVEPRIVELTIDESKAMLAQKAAMGISVKDIAHQLGRSEAWVRQYKKEPEIRAIITELQKEALECAKLTITAGTALAAETMVKLLADPNPGIKLGAARDLLDRLGLKAPDRKQVEANITITADPIERKKQLMERIKRLEMMD